MGYSFLDMMINAAGGPLSAGTAPVTSYHCGACNASLPSATTAPDGLLWQCGCGGQFVTGQGLWHYVSAAATMPPQKQRSGQGFRPIGAILGEMDLIRALYPCNEPSAEPTQDLWQVQRDAERERLRRGVEKIGFRL